MCTDVLTHMQTCIHTCTHLWTQAHTPTHIYNLCTLTHTHASTNTYTTCAQPHRQQHKTTSFPPPSTCQLCSHFRGRSDKDGVGWWTRGSKVTSGESWRLVLCCEKRETSVNIDSAIHMEQDPPGVLEPWAFIHGGQAWW